jgi:hypothetical protein
VWLWTMDAQAEELHRSEVEIAGTRSVVHSFGLPRAYEPIRFGTNVWMGRGQAKMPMCSSLSMRLFFSCGCLFL